MIRWNAADWIIVLLAIGLGFATITSSTWDRPVPISFYIGGLQ